MLSFSDLNSQPEIQIPLSSLSQKEREVDAKILFIKKKKKLQKLPFFSTTNIHHGEMLSFLEALSSFLTSTYPIQLPLGLAVGCVPSLCSGFVCCSFSLIFFPPTFQTHTNSQMSFSHSYSKLSKKRQVICSNSFLGFFCTCTFQRDSFIFQNV